MSDFPRIPLYTALAEDADTAAYADWCNIVGAAAPPRDLHNHALWLDDQGLALLGPELRKPFRLSAASLQPRTAQRTELVRACGPSGGQVLDLFAGFCMDGLTLAAQGFDVFAVERHPLVWLLARDFTARFDYPLAVQLADASQVLKAARDTRQRWDVIYLDPMFPARRKKALPGLAAQTLQRLVEQQSTSLPDQHIPRDLSACVRQALHCAPRVVLKRRRKDPLVADGNRLKPTHQYNGRSIRFDIYQA